MQGFIELTDSADKRIAMSIDSIRMFSEESSGCIIRFKNLSGHIFKSGTESFPTGNCHVMESYDVVKRKILDAEAAA